MRISLKNYYAVSLRFNGHGKGFAVGFDTKKAAYYFVTFILLGFGDVLEDWQLENRFPKYFHDKISKTI